MQGFNKKITLKKSDKIGKEWIQIGSTAALWLFSSATAIGMISFGTLIFIQIQSSEPVHQDVAKPIMLAMMFAYVGLLLSFLVQSIIHDEESDA